SIRKADFLRLAPCAERCRAPDKLLFSLGRISPDIAGEFGNKVAVAPCKSTATVQTFDKQARAVGDCAASGRRWRDGCGAVLQHLLLSSKSASRSPIVAQGNI